LKHASAARPRAGDPRFYQREPSQDSPIQHAVVGPYFPEGGVAAPPFMIVNPISHGPEDFPGGGTPNQLVGQAAASWVQLRASDEQGIGVDPNRRWPKQHHSATFNFTSLDLMPFPDQLGPYFGSYYDNVNRPVKAGWSVPKYGEQYEQQTASYSIGDLSQTADPASVAFAIGWGYVGG
jgi:hypothetical protein